MSLMLFYRVFPFIPKETGKWPFSCPLQRYILLSYNRQRTTFILHTTAKFPEITNTYIDTQSFTEICKQKSFPKNITTRNTQTFRTKITIYATFIRTNHYLCIPTTVKCKFIWTQ